METSKSTFHNFSAIIVAIITRRVLQVSFIGMYFVFEKYALSGHSTRKIEITRNDLNSLQHILYLRNDT